MFKIILFGIALFLLGLAACKVYQQKTVVKSDSAVWASYARGACFGKCPVYEFIVFENGDAIYKGEKNVEMIGTYASSLDTAQQASFKMLFEKSNFSSLQDEYLSNISDLPVISIELQQKTCDFHHRNAPKELKELTEGLDTFIKELAWTKK